MRCSNRASKSSTLAYESSRNTKSIDGSAVDESSASSSSSSSSPASIFALMTDSSNCAYASKINEKSRTVETLSTPSSYTSRAASNKPRRM